MEKTWITIIALLIFIAVAGIIEGYKSRRLDGFEAIFFSALLFVAVACGALLWSAYAAEARDLDGRYAGTPLHSWFQSLRSDKWGLCCADADGIPDPEWESKDGHYRVKIGSEWKDVADSELVNGPNLFGRAMVWLWHGPMGVSVRCFMPGSMT